MHVFANTNVDKAAVLNGLRADGFEFERGQRVERTWYDTFDFRLTRAGMRLEAITGRDASIVLWQADAPPAYLRTNEVPTFASEISPGPFRARLAGVTGVRALLPVARLRAEMAEGVQRNAAGKVVARLSISDDIVVDDLSGAALGWAIELDALVGYDRAAGRVTKRLASFGLDGELGNLFDLGISDGHIKPTLHDPRPRLVFAADERALTGYRRVFGHLFETIEANWDGVANDLDTEFLHDLRVAVRRTRSVLANANGVMPDDERERFAEGFHRLATATSETRDLDVALLDWDKLTAPLPAKTQQDLAPVRVALARRRATAQSRFVRELKSQRTRRLIRDWATWLNLDTGYAVTRAGLPLRSVVNRQLRHLHRKLERDAADQSPDSIHTTRKDAKQLRYMVECFGGLFEPSARKAFVKRLSAFQDRLGIRQDVAVQTALLDAVANEIAPRPETMLALGQVTAMIQARVSEPKRKETRLFSKPTQRAYRALLESHR